MELTFILALTEMVMKYGVPGAISIVRTLDKNEVTLEDIQKLREMVPPPESYFEGKGE